MKKLSRAGLIRKVDAAFSRFIRKGHADPYGFCECVTCGKRMRWEEIQAGHWIKRGHAATRWVEENVYPQCRGCNMFSGGRQDEMAAHIVRTHGAKVLEDLIQMKHSTKRWTLAELRELRERYEEK
jgi:hypothetical protein